MRAEAVRARESCPPCFFPAYAPCAIPSLSLSYHPSTSKEHIAHPQNRTADAARRNPAGRSNKPYSAESTRVLAAKYADGLRLARHREPLSRSVIGRRAGPSGRSTQGRPAPAARPPAIFSPRKRPSSAPPPLLPPRRQPVPCADARPGGRIAGIPVSRPPPHRPTARAVPIL